jgi:hypothetical protein
MHAPAVMLANRILGTGFVILQVLKLSTQAAPKDISGLC